MAIAAAILVITRGTGSQSAVTPTPAAPPSTAKSAPDAAQPYLDKAKAGDVYAMRMLGVMYLQGLNVPRDREKGLYWYRKAAENGSAAARAELSKIEGGR
jgi:TPR repeat protein